MAPRRAPEVGEHSEEVLREAGYASRNRRAARGRRDRLSPRIAAAGEAALPNRRLPAAYKRAMLNATRSEDRPGMTTEALAAPGGARGRGDRTAEYQAIALVSAAHFANHFQGLVLPPLFPFLKIRARGRLCRAWSRADRRQCRSRSRRSCRSGFWSTGSGRGACWWRRCSAAGPPLSGSGCRRPTGICCSRWRCSGLANAVFHPADYALLSAQNSGDPARPRLLDPYLFRVSRQCRRAGDDARAGRVWRVELRADRGRYSRHRRRAAAGAGPRRRGRVRPPPAAHATASAAPPAGSAPKRG